MIFLFWIVQGATSKRKGVIEKDKALLRMLTEATVRGYPPGKDLHLLAQKNDHHTNIFIYFIFRLASQQYAPPSLCGVDRKILGAIESLLQYIDPE